MKLYRQTVSFSLNFHNNRLAIGTQQIACDWINGRFFLQNTRALGFVVVHIQTPDLQAAEKNKIQQTRVHG